MVTTASLGRCPHPSNGRTSFLAASDKPPPNAPAMGVRSPSPAHGQWLIIQGRLDGNALLPFGARTVAERDDPFGEQHPQPDGWASRA